MPVETAKLKTIIVECPWCLNLIEHPADGWDNVWAEDEFTCPQCNEVYVIEER